MIRTFTLGLILTASLPAQTRLDPAAANALLIEKPEAVYPPLAKQARIQGIVKMDVTVSSTGTVGGMQLLSGHPLLVKAAHDAVQRRLYSPYLVDGKATPFRTAVEVPFSLGISDEEYRRELEVTDRFYKSKDQCRQLLRARKFDEAVESCKSTLPLADSLGEDQNLAKSGAYQDTSYALMALQRYEEALGLLKRAHELGVQAKLTDQDAEMAYLYRDMAMVHQLLRNLDEARSLYGKAEKSLRMARESIQSEELKQAYQNGLREVLKYYLLAAEEAGVSEEVQAIRKRLDQLQ